MDDEAAILSAVAAYMGHKYVGLAGAYEWRVQGGVLFFFRADTSDECLAVHDFTPQCLPLLGTLLFHQIIAQPFDGRGLCRYDRAGEFEAGAMVWAVIERAMSDAPIVAKVKLEQYDRAGWALVTCASRLDLPAGDATLALQVPVVGAVIAADRVLALAA